MHDKFKDMLGTDHLTFREGGGGGRNVFPLSQTFIFMQNKNQILYWT